MLAVICPRHWQEQERDRNGIWERMYKPQCSLLRATSVHGVLSQGSLDLCLEKLFCNSYLGSEGLLWAGLGGSWVVMGGVHG